MKLLPTLLLLITLVMVPTMVNFHIPAPNDPASASDLAISAASDLAPALALSTGECFILVLPLLRLCSCSSSVLLFFSQGAPSPTCPDCGTGGAGGYADAAGGGGGAGGAGAGGEELPPWCKFSNPFR